jgi:hypothetical protein
MIFFVLQFVIIVDNDPGKRVWGRLVERRRDPGRPEEW